MSKKIEVVTVERLNPVRLPAGYSIAASAKPAENLICMTAAVEIKAAASEGDQPKGKPTFNVVAYTGGAMSLNGWSVPVVVDLDGMGYGNSLVANLDHEPSKRVGHVTGKQVVDGQLHLSGIVSAATESAREVVESAESGFVWQASIEARPDELVEVEAGVTVQANGREFTGPLYLARKSTLKGFGFVSHGADDNTTVSIAATAASTKKGTTMDPKLKAWIEAMGFDTENLSDVQLAGLKANYEGQNGPKPPTKFPDLNTGIEAKKAERDRQETITDIACRACDSQPHNIDAIKVLAEQAIDDKWTVDKFRLELLEASAPAARIISAGRGDKRLSSKVLEAAVCVAGRLDDVEKKFDDQTLQAAHDRFPHGIGLNQLIMLGAEANGYRSQYDSKVSIDAQRAAFGMANQNQIRASGFSTVINIPTILSNVANKFLRRGWNSVDMSLMQIAAVRSVNDFKTITTVSLIGDLSFEKVGPDGEIKHGTIGEHVYTNRAETYAKMLAITRQDYINDDLGALTEVPRKLGRGAALTLNQIFWREFLNNGTFFTVGNKNVSTDDGRLTTEGLSQAEQVFMNQTDPDGNPLGTIPQFLVVPYALRGAAMRLMNSERTAGTGATDGDANIWRDRFTVVSSPYLSNPAFTGNSSVAWYLLADPNDIPVIEIAALNGRVEPVIEQADADFNVLGAQMRGYSDVGVKKQEYRGGVRADGSSPD